jgi:hypothetical protein
MKVNNKTQAANKIKNFLKSKLKKKSSGRRLKQPLAPNFGPVSTIDTAPVAIGNSIKGAKMTVVTKQDRVIVSGRDFMFPAIGTGSITTWCTAGGTPITPACFSDSVLRNYMQMYQKFRVRKVIAHFITSSPTSANGDVLFYFQKNANSVYINQTSTQLLPLVMSDPNTVIGPQWRNHSVQLEIDGETYKSTDYGMSSNINDYSSGNLFLLSKTSTTDSPGYVIFDYVIEFTQLQVSPRLLSLPIGRIQWTQLNMGRTAVVTTVNSTPFVATVQGNNLAGSASTIPAGCTVGDIYKVILDSTNSGAYTNATTANIVTSRDYGANYNSITVADGFTCYAIYGYSNEFALYPTVESAFAGGLSLFFGASATITFNWQVWLSYVGSNSNLNLLPNY